MPSSRKINKDKTNQSCLANIFISIKKTIRPSILYFEQRWT